MKRIYLIGYMGAGKTTLGRLLAKEMSLSFIDLDLYIEERYHMSVKNLFAEKGETAFREIEKNMLYEVSQFENVIIATGGGAPCFHENLALMNATGTTIYLETSVQVLYDRLKKASHSRPVLQHKNGDELKQFITDNLIARNPFYKKASLIFNADKLDSSKEITESVAELKYLIEKTALNNK